MDQGIVLMIALAVLSLVGSIAKKAQTKTEADKRKEAAAKRARNEQTPREKQPKQQEFRAGSVGIGIQREAMQPFGGVTRTAQTEAQPQGMSAFFDDGAGNRRVVPDEGAQASAQADESAVIELQYDKDSLLQGIILAEVLKRPKPGSYRQMPANR